jgi:hypothetical protein
MIKKQKTFHAESRPFAYPKRPSNSNRNIRISQAIATERNKQKVAQNRRDNLKNGVKEALLMELLRRVSPSRY